MHTGRKNICGIGTNRVNIFKPSILVEISSTLLLWITSLPLLKTNSRLSSMTGRFGWELPLATVSSAITTPEIVNTFLCFIHTAWNEGFYLEIHDHFQCLWSFQSRANTETRLCMRNWWKTKQMNWRRMIKIGKSVIRGGGVCLLMAKLMFFSIHFQSFPLPGVCK